MTIAFVFPGQGSQVIGMGKDFYDNFAIAKEVFLEVDEVLKENLSQLIFSGDIKELTLTYNTQPALMATSIAIIKVIEHESGQKINKLCNFVAGHSLGEYSALCATKAISLNDTAKLLRIRGKSMHEAVENSQGAMAALLGLDIKEVQKICDIHSKNDVCEVANDNCPGQVVISGNLDSIEKAIEYVKNMGKKAIKLNVSAPFHCSLMNKVGDIMDSAIKKVDFSSPLVPLIANVSADVSLDPEEIKQNLVKQVYSTVRWTESMETLKSEGVNKIFEIGAGQVLTGLFKRFDKNFETKAINTVKDLDLLKNLV